MDTEFNLAHLLPETVESHGIELYDTAQSHINLVVWSDAHECYMHKPTTITILLQKGEFFTDSDRPNTQLVLDDAIKDSQGLSDTIEDASFESVVAQYPFLFHRSFIITKSRSHFFTELFKVFSKTISKEVGIEVTMTTVGLNDTIIARRKKENSYE